jgi:translation elongation factor EF-Tu-like GTPase
MSDIKFKTADNIYSLDTDFIGKLYFLTVEEGGRSEMTDEIYRPLFKLKNHLDLTSADQKFIGKNRVKPGDTIQSEIRIIWKDPYIGSLSEGAEFVLREGSQVVATGQIMKVLNQKLKLK